MNLAERVAKFHNYFAELPLGSTVSDRDMSPVRARSGVNPVRTCSFHSENLPHENQRPPRFMKRGGRLR